MPSPDDYSECHGPLRHAWYDYDSNWTPLFGTPYTAKCDRCGTERRYIFDMNGKLTSRSYIHPPGYSWPKGTKPSTEEFRLMAAASALRKRREAKRDTAAAKKAAG